LALLGAAACGTSSPSVSDDLHRDLELARGQGLELAPRGGGQSTVSAAELLPRGTKTPTASAARTPAKTHAVAPKSATPAVAEAPEPATVEMPAPAKVEDPGPATPAPVRPQPASAKPAMNPAPPGGYKGMGELIRKAPFPINP
jgi:hypothetical protein